MIMANLARLSFVTLLIRMLLHTVVVAFPGQQCLTGEGITRCYWKHTGTKNYTEAMEQCVAEGGVLAIIDR